MLYGDFHFTHIKKNLPDRVHALKSDHWDANKHLNKWYMIHKPIMKTKCFVKVLETLEPNKYLHTQHVVNYLIAIKYGSTYDPTFIASWNKHEYGLHTVDSSQKTSYTKIWLIKNRDRIFQELN